MVRKRGEESRMRKYGAFQRRLAVSVLSAALLMTGCGASRGGASSGSGEGTDLNIGVTWNAATMDPQYCIEMNSATYINMCIGRLYTENSEHQLVPELAESVEISEDGKTYTFHLRPENRFGNGEPIRAEDFVYAWRRAVDPASGSQASYVFDDLCRLKNVDKIKEGKMSVEELGVSAPDGLTLRVELQEPCPYFLYVVALTPTAPMSRAFIEALDEPYGTSPESILSSGPFLVDRYDPLSTQVHYVRNPYYVFADQVKIPGICITQQKDEQQEMMAYQAGVLDAALLYGEVLSLTEGDPNLIEYGSASIYFMMPNFNRVEAFQNRNILAALNLSVNRESIAKNLMKQGHRALTRLIPDGFAKNPDGTDFAGEPDAFRESCGYAPEKALEYWKKGLKELGTDSLRFEILTESGHQDVSEVIAAEWMKLLPELKVDIRPVNTQQQLQLMGNKDFDLCFTGWTADYPDPAGFLAIFTSDAFNNYGEYTDPEFDRLIKESSLELEPERRNEMLHEAERILVEDAGFIPLYTSGATWLVSDNVSGFHTDFTGFIQDCRFVEKREKAGGEG